jgi:hypothetical protein
MSEVSDERYEELRGYIEEWLKRPCTLEEAKEIGDGLVDFYELLMRLDAEAKENDNEENESRDVEIV